MTTSIQRRRLIERAEGYLELAVALGSDMALDLETKTRLADRALECLNLIKNPLGHKPYVLFLKGRAYGTAEKHVQAIRYLEQSLRIDPDNIHLCFALGWSYKRTGKITNAIEAMMRACELDSESAIAHYNLACYLALDDHLESALKHLSFAFELDPSYREMAVCETDFELIRSDPRFHNMVANVDPAV